MLLHLLHLNLDLLLGLLAHNCFVLTDFFHLVLNHLLLFDLLLEHESLNHALLGPQDLLLSLDSLHFPLGLHTHAVLVFLVDVAVLVAMHRVGERLSLAAGLALARGAASCVLCLAPESTDLVVAATTATGGLATALAAAAGVLPVGVAHYVLGLVAEGKLVSFVDVGPRAPVNPAVAADSALERVSSLEVERSFVEVLHIEGPGGKSAGNHGKVGECAICPLALHFGLGDGSARRGWVPGHLRFAAEALALRNSDSVHLGWGIFTGGRALGTADSCR